MYITEKYMIIIYWAYVLSVEIISNTFLSGGQLWNHWFGLKFGYKWTCKTIEFYQNKNNNATHVYADTKCD